MRSFQKLQGPDRALLGTFCALGSIDSVELACHAGFDFVIIDGQHGTFDARGIREAIRAVDASGGFPVVRLPANGLSAVEGILDMGCPALLAPMINTPEQAAELVATAYYPPNGRRSQSGCRASLREGQTYRQSFNRDFTLIVMIEHMSAANRIEAIMAVPGVTACFIGPTDLASSLESSPAAPGQPDLAAMVEQVHGACAAAGKPVGIAARNVDAARRYARQGFNFIAVGTDRRSLSSAFEQIVSAWRTEAVT